MNINFTHARWLLHRSLPQSLIRHVSKHAIPLISHRQLSTTFSINSQLQLRPYQQDCITTCLAHLSNADKSKQFAVSLPTGSGKTVIFSHLLPKIPQPSNDNNNNNNATKSLILVHRKELATQALNTLKKANPSSNVQMEMSDYKADISTSDVIIASVQTLIRRLDKFDPTLFKAIIIDEAHHASAESYLQVLAHFGITKSGNEFGIPLIGFSATLSRNDLRALDQVFHDVVYHLDLSYMIENNHLIDAKFSTFRLNDADLGGVKTRAGEFVLSGLSREMNKPQNNEFVVRTYLHFAESYGVKSTLLFAVDIQHVENLTALFRDRGISTEFVTAKTKSQVRAKIIQDFKDGKISVLINCGIFTEGTDMPNIDSILLARPTKSRNLLIQMIGRGLRLHHEKTGCHVVDFIGVNGKDVISVPRLRNLPEDLEFNGLSLDEMEVLKKDMDEAKMKKADEAKKARQREIREKLKLRHEDEYITRHEDEVDESQFENIELNTFESMADFINQIPSNTPANEHNDYKIIKGSRYPWLQGPSRYEWILKLPESESYSTLRFLKLNIHSLNSLKHSFFADISFSETYTPEELTTAISVNQGTKLYTLTLYQSNPKYGKHFQTKQRFSSEKRFQVRLVTQLTHQIKDLLQVSELFFNGKGLKSNYIDSSKFAKWRQTQPTKPQFQLLDTIIDKCYDTVDKVDLAKVAIRDHELGLKKGDVSDLLTLWGIYRGKVVKRSLDRVIEKWRESNDETVECPEILQ